MPGLNPGTKFAMNRSLQLNDETFIVKNSYFLEKKFQKYYHFGSKFLMYM
jgi:hypothetical protein